jgi:hypothetical protein
MAKVKKVNIAVTYSKVVHLKGALLVKVADLQ